MEKWETITCKICKGDGFTAEHDPNDPHENGCSNCPIQVQCDDCHAEGKYMTLDVVRSLLLEQRQRMAKEIEGEKKTGNWMLGVSEGNIEDNSED